MLDDNHLILNPTHQRAFGWIHWTFLLEKAAANLLTSKCWLTCKSKLVILTSMSNLTGAKSEHFVQGFLYFMLSSNLADFSWEYVPFPQERHFCGTMLGSINTLFYLNFLCSDFSAFTLTHTFLDKTVDPASLASSFLWEGPCFIWFYHFVTPNPPWCVKRYS